MSKKNQSLMQRLVELKDTNTIELLVNKTGVNQKWLEYANFVKCLHLQTKCIDTNKQKHTKHTHTQGLDTFE